MLKRNEKRAKKDKKTSPEEMEYNGKILVRLPKSLHKELIKKAKEEGVSLNQYIIYKLAQ
jgi:antitoxin HicB